MRCRNCWLRLTSLTPEQHGKVAPPKLLKVVDKITELGFDVKITRLPDSDDLPCECAL